MPCVCVSDVRDGRGAGRGTRGSAGHPGPRLGGKMDVVLRGEPPSSRGDTGSLLCPGPAPLPIPHAGSLRSRSSCYLTLQCV